VARWGKIFTRFSLFFFQPFKTNVIDVGTARLTAPTLASLVPSLVLVAAATNQAIWLPTAQASLLRHAATARNRVTLLWNAPRAVLWISARSRTRTVTKRGVCSLLPALNATWMTSRRLVLLIPIFATNVPQSNLIQALAIYSKAQPELSYQDLEKKFRAANFSIYLIASVSKPQLMMI
jgi:hypothetical protein